MKKTSKRIIRIALIAALQVGVFILLHETIAKFIPLFIETSKSQLSWGITIEIALYTFSLFALMFAVALEFIKKKKLQFVVFLLVSVSYVSLFSSHLEVFPHRASLLMGSAIVGFLVGFGVYWKWSKVSDRTNP